MAVFNAVSAKPLRAPCVDIKYWSTFNPSLKFAVMGVSIIDPSGLAIKPLMPANCLICAAEPRAPESAIIKTENLRELSIRFITIEDKLAELISKQSRLIVLSLTDIYNATMIRFPSSIKKLDWFPKIGEDAQLYKSHLIENCTRLELKEFNTNVKLMKLDWLNTTKMKRWTINGARKFKDQGRYLMEIYGSINDNMLLLNREADYCFVWSKDISSLKLLEKTVCKLTIFHEFNEQTAEKPILENVTDLKINWFVTENHFKWLVPVFPQFTEAELKTKGRMY